MRILIETDYEAMSLLAAKLVAMQMHANPRLVLGLATGSTPLGVYRVWRKWVQAQALSFAEVTTFNLDEYVGLPPEHPQSYHAFMREQLFDAVDLRPENTHIPDGIAKPIKAQCLAYEHQIAAAGGIDVQLLGIGRNGHIGFNEPGEAFGEGTHVVRLQESTRRANARFFNSLQEVPREAVTMGLRSIMNARQILLLAAGEDKAEAVAEALLGEVTPRVPASILQLHPNCTFLLDRAAAAKLPAHLTEQEEGVR